MFERYFFRFKIEYLSVDTYFKCSLLFLIICRRIRDHPESGRFYKWRFGFQLVLAYLSFSMGMRPIVTTEVGKGPSQNHSGLKLKSRDRSIKEKKY